MNKILSIPAGRSSERLASFPDVLLYRGRAGDGADCLATFDRSTVVLSRPVAGLACRIRLPARQYRAVATVAGADRHVVQLMHREPGLSVDLAETDCLQTAEEYCERLAEFLDLPQLTVAGRAAPEAGQARPKRRRNRSAAPRRARFLTRRRTGNVVPLRAAEGTARG